MSTPIPSGIPDMAGYARHRANDVISLTPEVQSSGIRIFTEVTQPAAQVFNQAEARPDRKVSGRHIGLRMQPRNRFGQKRGLINCKFTFPVIKKQISWL